MSTTETIRIGIAGHGNLGRGVEASIARNPDMALVGIFTRRVPDQLVPLNAATPVHAMDALAQFEDRIDVLILCGGSKADLPQ
ncbi:MAG: diaminopimelate dehydrogenase, partial [Giesbergeria sp.]|nr:diaminopimelate dehydrogenase [Giesbergeria sp.]